MIARLFAPVTPAEELRRERERVARKTPKLSIIAQNDPRPDPDMFAWRSVEDLWERS